MFVGIVLIAALAVTGIQRRSTVKHKVADETTPGKPATAGPTLTED